MQISYRECDYPSSHHPHRPIQRVGSTASYQTWPLQRFKFRLKGSGAEHLIAQAAQKVDRYSPWPSTPWLVSEWRRTRELF